MAPAISPVEPLKQDLVNRLSAPGELFFMGSDELGRDIFSRVLWGSRITIPAGLAVIIIGSTLGVIIGAVAGYAGGLVDELLMRLTELFMAFPFIILAMAVTAALGPDIRNAVLALSAVWWPRYARILRGLVLEVKSQEFVEAAHSAGAGGIYVLFRTILAQLHRPGRHPCHPRYRHRRHQLRRPQFHRLGPRAFLARVGAHGQHRHRLLRSMWMWLFPGLAIASLVMAFNFIGDGLRDILDPRLRGNEGAVCYTTATHPSNQRRRRRNPPWRSLVLRMRVAPRLATVCAYAAAPP